MKKNLSKIGILSLAVTVLGGCGKEGGTSLEDMLLPIVSEEEDEERNGASGSYQVDDSQPEAGDISGKDGQSTVPERAAALEAYITVLEDIFFEQKFPGDQDYGYQPVQEYDVATNQFAVYDIDGDGKEELLVTWTTTYTAGQGEIVYGFDSVTGAVTEELRAYPLLTYYDNGIVEEQMSHNHGMAPDGDFWPYILHQYDEQMDRYTVIASVDAWSRAYREEDYDGNPFPEEVDADGDGMVYYTMESGIYALENPLDGEEYRLWRDSYIKGAQPVKVPYVKLTPDNIYALGAGTSGISEDNLLDFLGCKKEHAVILRYRGYGWPGYTTVTDKEPATIEAMDAFAAAQGYQPDMEGARYHHEIYLSDARRCKPENLKTVIRHPVAQKE